MRALPFQAPAPHVYIRMRQANIEKRLSKSWPQKKIRSCWWSASLNIADSVL